MRSLHLRALLNVSLAAAALSSCGGPDGPTYTGSTASQSVGKAAGVSLKPLEVPKDAKEDGIETAYSNEATKDDDDQIIYVFEFKSAELVEDNAEDLKDAVGSSGQVDLFTQQNIVVLYGDAGEDRTAEVKAAVAAL